MKRVLSFKKPLVWILIVAVIVAGVAAVFLFKRQPVTEVSDALDACIVSAFHDEYNSDYTEGKYPVVTYTALDVQEKKDTVTVYGVMMYREYTATTQNELKTWGTVHAPFALTAKAAGDAYELVDCWWPENSTDYKSSIKKQFPSHIQEKAINYQRYYGPHDLACEADAAANIADADKYTVLQSEGENVWLAYQEQGTHCYIVSSRGYNFTGTFTFDGNMQQILTFGNCKMVLDINGNHRIYNAEDSQAVPTSWESFGETIYLAHGIRFSPVVRGTTALVGDTLTIKSYGWMTGDEIRKMFGYVPNNDDATASEERPYYRPVKMFTSRPQLDVLLSQHMEDSVWTDLNRETVAQFDEEFFEKNSLIMIYYQAGSDLPDPQVNSFVYTEEGTCLSVRLNVDETATGDTVMTQWLLFAGIAKSDIEGITVLEAYVEQTTDGDGKTLYQGTDLSFTGKVELVEGNAMLMSCYDVDQFVQGVWVNLGDIELDPMVGEEYVVTYEDMMMPSLPPRITAITVTKP